MVPADSGRISRVPPYSGYQREMYFLTCTGLSPSMAYLSRYFHFRNTSLLCWSLQPHMCRNTYGLGCSPFARRYSGNHYCFLFLRVLRCFSSPGSPPLFREDTPQMRGGFPHSEICGSQAASASPQLIAGSHVLHRLREPRHPPCARKQFFSLYFLNLSNISKILKGYVENKGFEPLTPCVQGRCSSQLS